MAFNFTCNLGQEIDGGPPNPNPNRLNSAYAWYDAAFDLSADSSGALNTPRDPVGGPGDGPNKLVWAQSGAPFGSVQTQHSVSAGSLPPGVKLVQKEVRALIMPGSFNPWPVGVLNEFGIAGIPTETGVFTGSFGASGAFGGDTFSITVQLVPGCPLITILPAEMDPAFEGLPVSQLLVGDTGVAPYVLDVIDGELPPGLSLSSGGLLSGIPTTIGDYEFTVRLVDDNGCTAIKTYSMEILEATEVEFDSDSARRGDIGLSWVELKHVDLSGADKTYLWAPVQLNDPGFYYGGKKEARILGFSELTRALSDKWGQYEKAEFGWVQQDADRLVRALLGGRHTKFMMNRQCVIRMISDADRRLFRIPRIVARGVVRGYKPLSPLHFQFRAEDFLSSKFGLGDQEKQITQRKVSRADFQDCPTDAIDKPVPIIYGDFTFGSTLTTVPIITGDSARGAYSDEGYWAAGWGNLTSAADPVTGVTFTAAAGGALSADVPNAEYGGFVTAVDASGNESDPVPFFTNQPGGGSRGSFPSTVPKATVDGTQKITVAWTGSAGADKYRIYLGWYYYGFRATQFIEQDAADPTTCEFTDNPPWLTPVDSSNITAGASTILFSQFWYYAVSAVGGDGSETSLSPEVFGYTNGYRRPPRIEWLPVTGAATYRVYRRGAGGTWDRMWETTDEFFEDDLLDTGVTYIDGVPTATGPVPTRYVGTKLIDGFPWDRYLICGHAVKSVEAWYEGGVQSDPGTAGVDFLIPGVGGQPLYEDVNGHRYAFVYARGPRSENAKNGTAPITLTLKGIEDVGDGTGDLVEQIADIYLHFLQNWGFQSYQTGAWLDSPDWPTDVDGAVISQVDDASFATVRSVHEARLAGGYPGAIIFGAKDEFVTLREAIARLNISADCQSGFNRNSQFFVSIFDDAFTVYQAARRYTQVREINASSFDLDTKVDEMENTLVYSYRRSYVPRKDGKDWEQLEKEVSDDDSIEDALEERRSKTIEYHGLRNGAVVADINTRRLRYYKEPPVPVTFETSLPGLRTELGDIIKVDHIEGLTSAGWVGHPLRVMRHSTDPGKYKVRMEAVDVWRLYTSGFILGDETAIGASWATATGDDQAYGYLADETTGVFSDGQAGKRIR
jgi:hypothetical protein